MTKPRWPLVDKIALAEAFARGGLNGAAAAFPSKTRETIRAMLIRDGYLRAWLTYTPWLAPEVAILRRMWAHGASRGEIAKALGRTSAAVDSESHRLKLPRRTMRWTPGRLAIVHREVDAFAEMVGAMLGRSPRGIGGQVIDVLYADPRTLGVAVAKRAPGGRRWTTREYLVVAAHVDQLIQKLMMRFGCTEGPIKNRVIKSLCSYGVRAKTRRIVDLGGMSAQAVARPRKDAA
jgi:hypothetical protein